MDDTPPILERQNDSFAFDKDGNTLEILNTKIVYNDVLSQDFLSSSYQVSEESKSFLKNYSEEKDEKLETPKRRQETSEHRTVESKRLKTGSSSGEGSSSRKDFNI